MRRIVAVDAPAAVLAAAETLRREGHDGTLTLIGAEPHPPYDRPPLSKRFLTGRWTSGQAALRPPADLDALDLDLRLGTAATGLDPVSRTVRPADGPAVSYDALPLRGRLGPGRRLVVVGAGFLGAEAAATAAELGTDVILLEPAPVPLAAVAGTEAGQVLSRALERGVRLRTGVVVSEVTEAGVLLADGEVVEGDEVLVALGSRPNTERLAGSGLTVDDGVACDAYCQAAPGVYAAGDVARWYNPLFERSMRIEHRTNAAEQGMAVARNLLTAPHARKPFAPMPHFWSDQYGMKIQAYGCLRGDDEVVVVEGNLAERRFTAVHRTGDRLTGALAVGMPPRAVRQGRQAIAVRTARRDAVPIRP
ncbi:NAD(P)/FAD-dependent oxidoreductase [Streptomyces phaeochromogenes]